jgi:hypothetical protein
MSHQSVRKFSSRKFKPSLSSLEERITPTVNSLSVAALTPGSGGANTVSIGGVIADSSSISARTLSVKHTVTDGHGHVLAGGPLTVSSPFPNSSSFSYQTVIPRSVAPGNIETISVFATDSDSMGVPLSATANLYVSAIRGVNTLGFGSTASNGDLFGGSGQGRITATQSTTKGLIARGTASLQLGSNPNNHELVSATSNGPFQFGIDTLGNVTFKNSRGRTNFKLGSYAGGPLSKGGIGGVISGNFNLTQFTDSSINAFAQGSAFLSVQLGGSTTTTPSANTETVVSHKLAITFTRDSTGHQRFSLVGNSTINGDFNNGSSFDILG